MAHIKATRIHVGMAGADSQARDLREELGIWLRNGKPVTHTASNSLLSPRHYTWYLVPCNELSFHANDFQHSSMTSSNFAALTCDCRLVCQLDSQCSHKLHTAIIHHACSMCPVRVSFKVPEARSQILMVLSPGGMCKDSPSSDNPT
jgi:hypothetical protein